MQPTLLGHPRRASIDPRPSAIDPRPMSDELESSSSPRLGLCVHLPSPSTRACAPYVAIGTCPARPWHAGAAVASTCPDGQVRSVARRPVRAENMLFSVPRRLGRRHWWGCRTANSRLAPAEVATRITASAVMLLNPLGRYEVGLIVPISVPRSTVEVYSETQSVVPRNSTHAQRCDSAQPS